MTARVPAGRALAALVLIAFAMGSSACDSLYYKTMSRFGLEKRDILVKRVRDARKAQNDAKEEFTTALERFRTVVGTEHSSLEDKYTKLQKELDRCEDRAKAVRDRVKAVRDVSDDLFKEWQKELKQYSDQTLRRTSERELRETQRRADALLGAMQRAERRIEPVLRPLRDRVLFLKHNLNAQAVGSLGTELTSLQGNVDQLVADLTASITEADTFITAMDADRSGT